MKNIFKNLNKGALVALASAGLFAISWTTIESKLAPQWYQVELKENGDPENLEDFEINPISIGSPTGDCDLGTITLCAVKLEVTSGPFPSNMDEAENFPAVNITARAHKD